MPTADAIAELNKSLYLLYEAGANALNFDNVVFGPNYDQTVNSVCHAAYLLQPWKIKECKHYQDLNDSDGVDAFNPIPTKLLEHYSQNFLEGKFQPYSDTYLTSSVFPHP